MRAPGRLLWELGRSCSGISVSVNECAGCSRSPSEALSLTTSESAACPSGALSGAPLAPSIPSCTLQVQVAGQQTGL